MTVTAVHTTHCLPLGKPLTSRNFEQPLVSLKRPSQTSRSRGLPLDLATLRWRIEEPAGSIATVCRQQQNLALEICGGIGGGLIGMRRSRAGLDKRRSQHEDGGYVS